MTNPGTEPKEGTAGEATRRRIVDAALESLKVEGFAGSSARAIARIGGFNQALIFYHFGTVADLLLAALDETSTRRLARYREAMEDVSNLEELVQVARDVYREDLEKGHIKVLAEMIAAASSTPGLGEQVVERIEPWIALTEDALAAGFDGSPLADLVPSGDLAFAIVALYLGMELLTHLDGDGSRADSLFAAGSRVGDLLTLTFLGSSEGGA